MSEARTLREALEALVRAAAPVTSILPDGQSNTADIHYYEIAPSIIDLARDALAAPAPPAPLAVERLARALPHVQTIRSLTIRLGTFNEAWWERFADEVTRAYAGEGERGE